MSSGLGPEGAGLAGSTTTGAGGGGAGCGGGAITCLGLRARVFLVTSGAGLTGGTSCATGKAGDGGGDTTGVETDGGISACPFKGCCEKRPRVGVFKFYIHPPHTAHTTNT